MQLTTERSTLARMKADAVAVFLFEDRPSFTRAMKSLSKLLGKGFERAATIQLFKGKEGDLLVYLPERKLRAPRLYLVGLGERSKSSLERFRRAAATAAKRATGAEVKHLALMLPDETESGPGSGAAEAAQAFAEGAWLALYRFDRYVTDKKKEPNTVRKITIVTASASGHKEIQNSVRETRIVCEATILARDLANAPANELYPETLAEAARISGEKYGYSVTVWDKKQIEEAGFGGLLAVNAGSNRSPRFIILEHNPGENAPGPLILVGKGITFDAGGISIKPASGMGEMKMDMSGAAAVIGTLQAAARLRLPVRLIGLIPSTENLLGGSAMRPGDIIRHYGKKTSEVDNTDAEGRLILADALAYASTYKPAAVIDLATLTGACVVALGQHATGMLGTDDGLMAQLRTAGEKTFERVWQLPLFEEYEKQIKSDVADVKNTGGRWAGAITAALFLKKFIGAYPWVHLDIAGTAILEEALPYAAKGGSGVGVRLLTEFLKHWKPAKP